MIQGHISSIAIATLLHVVTITTATAQTQVTLKWSETHQTIDGFGTGQGTNGSSGFQVG